MGTPRPPHNKPPSHVGVEVRQRARELVARQVVVLPRGARLGVVAREHAAVAHVDARRDEQQAGGRRRQRAGVAQLCERGEREVAARGVAGCAIQGGRGRGVVLCGVCA